MQESLLVQKGSKRLVVGIRDIVASMTIQLFPEFLPNQVEFLLLFSRDLASISVLVVVSTLAGMAIVDHAMVDQRRAV
jgi:hypothetical protein